MTVIKINHMRGKPEKFHWRNPYAAKVEDALAASRPKVKPS
jgi:hypothetical protein